MTLLTILNTLCICMLSSYTYLSYLLKACVYVLCMYISYALITIAKGSFFFRKYQFISRLFLTEQAWSHGGLRTRELGQDPSHVSMGD